MHPEHTVDPVTEALVLGLLDLIAERKSAGKRELAATMKTIAAWLQERTGLAVEERHIGPLTKVLAEAGLLSVGGGGIGYPNTYDTTESAMGSEQFWNQVEALLAIWRHPAAKKLAS